MNIKTQNYIFLILSYFTVLILAWVSRHNCFFWDTVQLASGHANYYYTNNFSQLLLPIDIDSGHIPTFGIYIAVLWKILGKSLAISHLAILPFSLGIVWQLFKLCQKFIPEKFVGIALFIILIDPTLLSQMTLVSPDVLLVFFFLLAINAILESKKWVLMFCILFLFLISMRGMMVSLCLFGLDLYYNQNFNINKKELLVSLVKRSLLYLPALLVFVAFNSFHYIEKGWIGYHQDSPWAKCFERVADFKSFLFNIALYGWRILDFGRIGIWVCFITLLVAYKNLLFKTKHFYLLGFFTICLMVFLPLNMLWAKNLLCHRYFLPIYLLVAIFCATVLFSDLVAIRLKYLLSTVWFCILLSGNFWIYPDKIAKGWDSTLAHLPYYNLRKQAIAYLDHQKIDFKEVQTFFPNTAKLNTIDLNNDLRNMDTFNANSNYVFYSNAFNIEDKEYDLLNNNQKYQCLKRFDSNGVYITIFKKNIIE